MYYKKTKKLKTKRSQSRASCLGSKPKSNPNHVLINYHLPQIWFQFNRGLKFKVRLASTSDFKISHWSGSSSDDPSTIKSGFFWFDLWWWTHDENWAVYGLASWTKETKKKFGETDESQSFFFPLVSFLQTLPWDQNTLVELLWWLEEKPKNKTTGENVSSCGADQYWADNFGPL